MPKKKPSTLKPKKINNYQRGPLWDWSKGVTQSSLTDFLSCREQFALGYVEGWTPRAFSVYLEFGTLIHFMLEKIANGSPEKIAREVCYSYEKARKKTLQPGDWDSLQVTLVNAEVIFPIYVKHWAEYDSKISWLEREKVFWFHHKFGTESAPSEEIGLTGMRDGAYRNVAGQLGLFETKTKSSIDDLAIQDGLRADLQTMLYLYSLQRDYKEEPGEILYNVIRRPQLRIKQNESLGSYGVRLADDINSRPDWYFRRFEVTVIPGDIETFIDTTLDPVLRLMLQWWESVKDNPFERWGSPYHFRNLTALTNRYGKARLYNLMVRGLKNEYYQRSSHFPELEKSLIPEAA